ncbi:hypothetical protein [Streptomyces sp. NPDC012616]|uniref:hypothetical protein n=1 Tax=Streptomyces sp. NPDC012616 TaxID=3364840 RepID=UPI0036E81E8A
MAESVEEQIEHAARAVAQPLVGGDQQDAAEAEADVERVEGGWRVGSGSQAGHRVDEVLFAQNVTAGGRTEKVTGELEIEGARAVNGSCRDSVQDVPSTPPLNDNTML